MRRPFAVICALVILGTIVTLTGQPVLYRLGWSTYVGGRGDDSATAVAVDDGANVYVVGTTGSLDFPTRSPLLAGPGPAASLPLGFVTKLRPPSVVYSTYIVGSPVDVAVDPADNAYVTGSAAGLPFVSKISADGSALLYSTRWCCGEATSISIDASGSALVAGDRFVAKIDSNGRVLSSTQFQVGAAASDVVTDAAGNVYVTGTTRSTAFPTTPGAFQSTPGRLTPCPVQVSQLCDDGFVMKFSPAGELVYSTLIGGEAADQPARLRVDQSGSVYLAGYTSSRNFPVTKGAFQPVCQSQYTPGDCGDGFVAKLDSRGSSLEYATFLGGSAFDSATTLVIDAAGRAVVGGYTASPDFPVGRAVQPRNAGGPIFKSTDGGATWRVANTGLSAYVVRKLVTTRRDPTAVYAATYFGLYRGHNEGERWSGGLLDFDVLDLAIDPQTPTIAYAVTNGGGVYKTLDGGAKWIALTIADPLLGTDRQAIAVAVAPSMPSRLYVLTTGCLYRSSDGGSTWTRLSLCTSGRAIAVDPRDAASVYVARFPGISKSRDSGQTWTALPSAPSDSFQELIVDPTAPSTLYATGSRGVFKSIDAGATWATITGIPSFPSVTLALDPSSPGTLYAGGFEILHKSTDGGATWTHWAPGPIRSITSLAVHPARSSTLYAGTGVDPEGFVAVIGADGSTLEMATYLGGARTDRLLGLALFRSTPRRIYVVGDTLSPDFPLATPFQSVLRGGRDAFIAIISDVYFK